MREDGFGEHRIGMSNEFSKVQVEICEMSNVMMELLAKLAREFSTFEDFRLSLLGCSMSCLEQNFSLSFSFRFLLIGCWFSNLRFFGYLFKAALLN